MTSAFCRFDDEQQRFRMMQQRIKETHGQIKYDTPHGVTLDGPFLLQLHCVNEPSQLCSVNISEQKLNSVKAEELKEFKNASYVDASINSLSLGLFSCFVSLRELDLSLNGICNLTFDVADFPHLKVLDLSYNSVSGEDTVSLGRLRSLKTLHLTGNQLRSLPLSFGSSKDSNTQLPSAEGASQFEYLEVLMLDDNKLSSEVFFSLADLRRLQYLNLQGNRISEIPHFQVRDSLKPGQLPAAERAKDEAHKSKPDHKRSFLPLPELQRLNLAENKVNTEEALIGAATFPKLRDLDIHSNPLITRKRGNLPFLTYYLQERLGVRIRQKKAQEVKKLPLKVSTDPKWKVEENIPKVSKRPFLKDAVCPTWTKYGKCDKPDRKKTQSDGTNSGRVQKNTKHFFITQAEEEPESEFISSTAEEQTAGNKRRQGTSSEESNILDPDVPNKPVGIQTAVRMLEHTLRNLNVYRDSKPKLDSIQTPYREREKKIKELPPLRPIKRPCQRVDALMKEMKQSATIKVVALGSALQKKGVSREDYKEARSLLRDMMVKHRMIHEEVMDRATSVDCDPNGADASPLQELQ